MLDSEKYQIISFCRIIYLKNDLDILDEYMMEYLYAYFFYVAIPLMLFLIKL